MGAKRGQMGSQETPSHYETWLRDLLCTYRGQKMPPRAALGRLVNTLKLHQFKGFTPDSSEYSETHPKQKAPNLTPQLARPP